MTFGQGQDTPFDQRQQLCEILSKSAKRVRRYYPDIDFDYMFTVALTLEIYMTMGQSHETIFVYGQELREILSRTNMAVRSYDTDPDFNYV